jgi:hypothetical protein
MLFTHAVRRSTSPAAFAGGVGVVAACSLVTIFVQLPNRVITETTARAIPLWAVTATSLTIVALACFALRRTLVSRRGVEYS